jgi:hypothetical protein
VDGGQRGADAWVSGGPEPSGSSGLVGAEMLSENLDQRDVEQPIEQRLLTLLIAEHFACEQVHGRPQRAA